jgi:hypothetical protein
MQRVLKKIPNFDSRERVWYAKQALHALVYELQFQIICSLPGIVWGISSVNLRILAGTVAC